MRSVRSIIAVALLAVTAWIVSAGAAQAQVPRHHPIAQTVWVEDENGVLTTPCPLTAGHVLTLIGYGPRDAAYVVVKVTDIPDGTSRVVLAGPPLPLPPGQHSGTFDFRTGIVFF